MIRLSDDDDDKQYFRERERVLLACWGDVIKTSIRRGHGAQAAGDARIAFHRAAIYLGYSDERPHWERKESKGK